MIKRILLFACIGFIIGIVWYRYGERFNQTKLKPKCWELLHYYDKEKLPLYIVHLKSILAGCVLVGLSIGGYRYRNEVIAFIGASIVGLHIYQWVNEMQAIKERGSELPDPREVQSEN